MNESSIIQLTLYLILLFIFVKPLGWYMMRVYQGKSCGLNYVIGPIEKSIYRFANIKPTHQMNWKTYLLSMLIFNFLGIVVLYIFLRFQHYLPFNPENFSGLDPLLAFNTAVSFATNTNWQAYSGETSLSYFSQMIGLAVQNFLSAATGMSILIALIRGIVGNETEHLGNYWVDLVRSILYILLPLSFILALILCSQGVIQNIKPYEKIKLFHTQSYHSPTTQIIPMGPVASQVAIKQLGTNGGGFFNTNSSHPYENPTPFSNLIEMLAILLIPSAFCYTFGLMVKDKRQGIAMLISMVIIFVPFVIATNWAELHGNPAFNSLNVDQHMGNMEGKEVRFGIINSSLWTMATAATSNGSVNSMLDSFTPLGCLFTVFMVHIGELVFGGAGAVLYGLLMMIIITVFIAGLMVGRTPEYLRKKIGFFEMKMAAFTTLIAPTTILLFTAIASITSIGVNSIGNPGPHGFTEILYNFSSLSQNNGSSFAGLNANTFFYNFSGAMIMLFARYWIAIPALALAGALARKKRIPITRGTLPTHTLLFILLLVSVKILLGALSFLPALSLGPIVEHLILWNPYGH